MSKCLGVGNRYCGVEFYDLQFPSDTVCNKCANQLGGDNE